jgi:hypothetical protein
MFLEDIGIGLEGLIAIGISLLWLLGVGVVIILLLVKYPRFKSIPQDNSRQRFSDHLDKGEMDEEEYDESTLQNNMP